MPPNDGPPPKVLLYLHGVGEAFNPIDDNDKAKLPERKLVPRLGLRRTHAGTKRGFLNPLRGHHKRNPLCTIG